jgi:hypothetical protein
MIGNYRGKRLFAGRLFAGRLFGPQAETGMRIRVPSGTRSTQQPRRFDDDEMLLVIAAALMLA